MGGGFAGLKTFSKIQRVSGAHGFVVVIVHTPIWSDVKEFYPNAMVVVVVVVVVVAVLVYKPYCRGTILYLGPSFYFETTWLWGPGCIIY